MVPRLPDRHAVLFGWTFALFLHLCTGIRHLAWDAGYGFEKSEYQATNWIGDCRLGRRARLLIWIVGFVIW